MGFELASIAPRLARARDQWLEEQRREHARLRRLASQRLELDRLVAHRELQLVRALATGDGRYIRRRELKLAQALRRRAGLEKAA